MFHYHILSWKYYIIKKVDKETNRNFLSGSLCHQDMTWSQPFLYTGSAERTTLTCPHIWPNSVQTQCVTHGQTFTLDQILPLPKRDFVNAKKTCHFLSHLYQKSKDQSCLKELNKCKRKITSICCMPVSSPSFLQFIVWEQKEVENNCFIIDFSLSQRLEILCKVQKSEMARNLIQQFKFESTYRDVLSSFLS